eukprot:2945044-Pyramimonas_sp.AAC.1
MPVPLPRQPLAHMLRALKASRITLQTRKRKSDGSCSHPPGASAARPDLSSRVSARLFNRVCEGRLSVKEAVRAAQDCVEDYGLGQEEVNKWA